MEGAFMKRSIVVLMAGIFALLFASGAFASDKFEYYRGNDGRFKNVDYKDNPGKQCQAQDNHGKDNNSPWNNNDNDRDRDWDRDGDDHGNNGNHNGWDRWDDRDHWDNRDNDHRNHDHKHKHCSEW
jgi:hypothetical protein